MGSEAGAEWVDKRCQAPGEERPEWGGEAPIAGAGGGTR